MKQLTIEPIQGGDSAQTFSSLDQAGDGEAYVNHNCPVCRKEASPFLKKNGYWIDRCPECGFAFVRDVPSRQTVAKFYENSYSGENGVFKPPTRLTRRITKAAENWCWARVIKRHAEGRSKLLEIGCGEGHLLKALVQAGFEVEGLDYGRSVVDYLHSLGLNVVQGDILDQNYPPDSFEFLVGFHVLEHVQNLDEFMSEVRRVLAPEGRIYFVVPCLTHYAAILAGPKWRYFGPPGHLWYFSVKAMKMFLSGWQFRILSVHCFSNRSHLMALAEKTG